MSRPRYNVLVSTASGPMIANRYDTGVTRCLLESGSFDGGEIAFLRAIVAQLAEGSSIIDAGANIGTHAIAMAEEGLPRRIRVYALEAQRLITYLLAGNVALASLENVYLANVAVGKERGVARLPDVDYGRPLAVGGVSMYPDRRPGEQDPGDICRNDCVQVIPIDDLGIPDVSLIKIDVEGMELDVLEGASETIRAHRPVLYVEHIRGDRDRIAAVMAAAGYEIHDTGDNYLGVPREMSCLSDQVKPK